MTMEITPFFEPESFTWSYLLADTTSGRAVIIDPVWVFDPVSGLADTGFTEQILAVAKQRQYQLDWVLETHAHADHLSSACFIREQTGAKIAIGRGICAVQKTFIKVFDLDDVPVDGSQFDRLLADGETITLGELDITVMGTPGHTSDSVTYVCGDAAFIGDTLFAPDYGTARCDFPGGNAAMLYDSIARIHGLPPQTRLHLCHDYPPESREPLCVVTVVESLENNVHVKAGTTRDEYVAMRTARDAQLSLPKLIFPAIQVNIRAGEAPMKNRHGTSYLKIPFNVNLADLLDDKSRQ